MPDYNYDSAVSVPAGDLTAFRSALTTVAGTLPAGNTWRDAFEKLANVALPVDNRFLAATTEAWIWAVNHKSTALRDAARAVLTNATGIP